MRPGDYVYLLAPPEKAHALDRFFVDLPPPAKPDPHLLGDFFVTGDHTLGELAEIYGLKVAANEAATTLADYFASELRHTPKQGEVLHLGPIALVAHKIDNDRVAAVGLRLPEDDDAGGDLAWSDQAQDSAFGAVRLIVPRATPSVRPTRR